MGISACRRLGTFAWDSFGSMGRATLKGIQCAAGRFFCRFSSAKKHSESDLKNRKFTLCEVMTGTVVFGAFFLATKFALERQFSSESPAFSSIDDLVQSLLKKDPRFVLNTISTEASKKNLNDPFIQMPGSVLSVFDKEKELKPLTATLHSLNIGDSPELGKKTLSVNYYQSNSCEKAQQPKTMPSKVSSIQILEKLTDPNHREVTLDTTEKDETSDISEFIGNKDLLVQFILGKKPMRLNRTTWIWSTHDFDSIAKPVNQRTQGPASPRGPSTKKKKGRPFYRKSHGGSPYGH